MKKFFAFILTLCMMASVLCTTAFAEESTDIVVIRVAGMREDGQVILPETYTSFKEGWNRAADLAQEHDWMDENGIVRIVVDLYDDWTASNGKFGSGEGFENSTIRVPGGTRMMINMNGHTIDRGLTKVEADGEVIFMGKKSDLIINGGQYRNAIVKVGEDPGYTKMGTIKGGYSNNGAGGIHMDGNGRLTLNNVHLSENKVRGDDGAAIAAYNNSVVVMNGGSISDSLLKYTIGLAEIVIEPYGALFVKDSTATLNHVTIDGNYAASSSSEGLVVYAKNSTVTLDQCLVSNNALEGENRYHADSIIAAFNSEIIIKNTDFTGNGVYYEHDNAPLFYFKDSSLTINGGEIKNNNAKELFYFKNSDAEIDTVTITDNKSVVVYVDNDSKKINMIGCTLGNNTPVENVANVQVNKKDTLAMTNCTLGDTTFNDKSMVAGVGSIFGEGSLTMVIALLALVASVATFFMVVDMKKKLVPVVANNEAKPDNEE